MGIQLLRFDAIQGDSFFTVCLRASLKHGLLLPLHIRPVHLSTRDLRIALQASMVINSCTTHSTPFQQSLKSYTNHDPKKGGYQRMPWKLVFSHQSLFFCPHRVLVSLGVDRVGRFGKDNSSSVNATTDSTMTFALN